MLGTTRSQLVFQLEDRDATELAPRFTPLTRDDLTNLGPHEIALRPCVGGITLPPVTGTTYPLPPPTTNPRGLAQISLRRYLRPTPHPDRSADHRTHPDHPNPRQTIKPHDHRSQPMIINGVRSLYRSRRTHLTITAGQQAKK